ncbi:unnamed protein product [Rhodiola kirilowii]
MAKFGKGRRDFRAGGSRGNFSTWNKGVTSSEDKGKPREKEDRTCYHCQKKGIYSKIATTKRKEKNLPQSQLTLCSQYGEILMRTTTMENVPRSPA